MIHRIIRTCFKISFKPIVLSVAESEWTKVTRNLQVTHVEAITTILVDSILVGISHNLQLDNGDIMVPGNSVSVNHGYHGLP